MNIDRLMFQIQHVQSEDSAMKRDQIEDMRDQRLARKRESLGLTENAQVIRGDAQDSQTQGQVHGTTFAVIGTGAMVGCTLATELGATVAIGSCANALPLIGQIIMLICMIIALIIIICVMIETAGKEREAAELERKAGEEDLAAEELDGEVDDLQDSRRENREQVQGFLQTYLQQKAENNDIIRESLD